ncbi:MAG: chromosome partitioning protein ParB [Rhizobiales bacterium 24-66-13]|jgi:ParB family chromosome partitioning protein|nr:MAG: chromosome partitioning protein ParB [Rhizobiales bacterium 35-66-30]OYZ82449.1 MAG: chromosome partitioning protein ParB [Rhizobiales bacterium 24-66-13]OZB11560.1 MAG: chromosome partitioning protein ParB [Rhizobiales bacterium 39-66-18]HQS08171.1 ParB N-terminal domain-containing protein [Xanthobacteraceae bacterium]
MAKVAKKITLSRSRDIPFNQLERSASNVRRIKTPAAVTEMAEDIAYRGLLQSLNVRPILDADGNETGRFEVPAGETRFDALELLVKQKRMSKTEAVPCVCRDPNSGILAEDDSLAENTLRRALHPLDEFRAFLAMREKGMSEDEIAFAHRTSKRVVAQRLALAKVSPKLHDAFETGAMSLAELEAFTAHPDHARQEQIWEAIENSHFRETWRIREMLTETSVPASDKRARFIGLDAYAAAGGPVLPRYLFDDDEDGWLEDVPLLDRLVGEKLKAAAAEVAAEGWKWVAADLELPYGYDHDLRGIIGAFAELTKKERRERDKLRKEQERLEAEYAGHDELPDEIDQRLGEIEKLLEAFERRPAVYDPAEIAIAGVFVSVDEDGELMVDRGWVRPQDEPVETVEGAAPELDADGGGEADGATAPQVQRAVITIGGEASEPEPDDDESVKPLPERLVIELTAHRTIALREAVGANPHVAMTALLHKLVRDTFRRSTRGASVQVSVLEVYCREQGVDLKNSPYAKAVVERNDGWKADVPADDDALWDWLAALDEASRMALLAHCVAYGINALYERPNPFSATGISEQQLQARMAEADRLARATGLDMAEAGFRPTVANYFGRITKRKILDAVAEAVGEGTANLLAFEKKDKMAAEAEERLANTGWLPEPLRLLADEPAVEASAQQDEENVALPDFLAGSDEAEAAAEPADDPVALVAAE